MNISGNYFTTTLTETEEANLTAENKPDCSQKI